MQPERLTLAATRCYRPAPQPFEKGHHMADISLRHAHGLSLEEAQAKIDKVVTDIQSEFSSLVSSIDWNADKTAAKVAGKGFSGDFLVNAQEVGIDINLSMFARPLKAKVQQKIEERIKQYFA